MNITVIGTGYVGLVTGACLAEMGNHVVCVDNDQDKIQSLQDGRLPLYEPGLEQFVRDNSAAQRLQFTTNINHGIQHGKVLFIAVGTPPAQDGSADLQYVLSVAESIGEQISEHCVVAIKSTVPVGVSEKVRNRIAGKLTQRGLTIPFSVVSTPEFLKQGMAVEDFMKPERIIIGAEDERALKIMQTLYAPFQRDRKPIIVMDVASAELTKYAANAMLATKISFMNEMSNLAERFGADIESVRIGIGADSRIGHSFMYPGCGYGGSCFPKDVRALHQRAAEVGYHARILEAVESVNNEQKYKPVEKIMHHFGENLSGKCFALWGLAFKPDTDDMREAPSCTVLEALWRMGATICAFDPAATEQAHRLYGTRDDLVLYSDDPYEALTEADGLLVLTEWSVLRDAKPQHIKAKMRGEVVVDGRNIYDPQAIRAVGLVYYGIGRH